MFEILPESDDKILAIRFTGTITLEDYQRFLPEADRIVAAGRPLRALLDWQALVGWAPEAESDRFLFRARHRGDVSRIAILGDERWEDEAKRMAEVMGCELRIFDPGEREAARAWLEEYGAA